MELMEKKKRRRSIRNLKRQSMNSFCDEGDITTYGNEDNLMLTINGGDNNESVFGTAWVEVQEETVKEKRKRRRSSILLQKPMFKIDSPDIEILRTDVTVNSPLYHTVVSPDIIKLYANPSPVLQTPDVSFNTSTNYLDTAFVSEFTTPVLSQLNDVPKKEYPVTPDVAVDFLDSSPVLNITMTAGSQVFNQNEFKDDEMATKDLPDQINEDFSIINHRLSYTSTKNNDNQTINYNTENLNHSCDTSSDNTYLFCSQMTLISTNPCSNDLGNPSPITNQSISIIEEMPINTLMSISIDKNSAPVSTTENQSEDNTITISKELKEQDQKGISPSSFTESLDNIASGAMGLFNSLVRRISIKRGKAQKKTPKRRKKEKFMKDDPIFAEDKTVPELQSVRIIQEDDPIQNNKLTCVEQTIPVEIQLMELEQNTTDINQKLSNNTSTCTSNILEENNEEVSHVGQQSGSVPRNCENVEMVENESTDNFDMKSLVASIDSSKENQMTKKRKTRRCSAEFNNISYCEDTDASISSIEQQTSEDEKAVRKSRRNRRKSLEIYKAGLTYENTEPIVKQFVTRMENTRQDEEIVNEIYLNKNYKAPLEKTWETIYESPNKTRQFVSKRKFRRVIDFEGFAPAKFKRRLQKAYNNGWNNFCGKQLNDDFVQSKLSDLYTYLDSSMDSS